MKFAEREQEILNVLKAIGPKQEFILVGGYAVNAYTLPGFSIDLDIAIPKEETGYFRKLLGKAGYKKLGKSAKLPYGGAFERFSKRIAGTAVSVDLLIGGIASRQTGAMYSFSYLKENSEARTIRCRTGTSNAMVADREMLAALKINSARKTDIRDLFMLGRQGLDAGRVQKHLQRVPKETLGKNIAEIRKAIEEKQFRDSIQGVFGLVDETSFRKTKGRVIELLDALTNG